VDAGRVEFSGCADSESVDVVGCAVSVGVGCGFGFGILGIFINCAEALWATKNTVMASMNMIRNERLIFASS
jgi:hypothetical protein